MNSHTTRQFRELLVALPARVQEQARAAYALFQQNPSHPGLCFKQVDSGPPPVYSARVGIAYRCPCWRFGLVKPMPLLALRAGQTGAQANARISPNSRPNFCHDAPPSRERYTCPLTLLA